MQQLCLVYKSSFINYYVFGSGAEALFCFHGVTKQSSAGSFVVYYKIFKSNQVLEALTLLYLITTGHSFPESPMKGHWQQCQRVFNETPRNLLASRRGS